MPVRRLSARQRRTNGFKPPTALGLRYAGFLREWFAVGQAQILAAVLSSWAPDPFIHTDARSRVHGQIGGLRVLTEEILDPKKITPQIQKFAARVSDHGREEFRRVIGIPSKDLGVGTKINQFREENVSKITSLVGKQLDDITGILENADRSALRVEDLSKELQKAFDVTKSKADLLARDGVLTLNGDLTQQRQTNAGITKYIWTTSHDERVRKAHADLDSETFSWNDPPIVDEKTGRRANPGQDFQCRCTAFPVLDELLDETETPEAPDTATAAREALEQAQEEQRRLEAEKEEADLAAEDAAIAAAVAAEEQAEENARLLGAAQAQIRAQTPDPIVPTFAPIVIPPPRPVLPSPVAGTPINVPEAARVFGNRVPTVEDLQTTFSAGPGFSTKIKSVKYQVPIKARKYEDEDAQIAADLEAERLNDTRVAGSVEVVAEIRNAAGKVVGKAIRNFKDTPDGLSVYLQEVKLGKQYQGQGIGKALTANSFRGFEEMGVKTAVCDAAWVGRYTWARMGYEADPAIVDQMRDGLRKHLVQEVGLDPKKATVIANGAKTMRDISSVRVGGEHAGKDYLLSERAPVYAAHLKIDRNDPGYKLTREYLGIT